MSDVLTIEEMVALERSAFADGVDPWELMQDAARQMARAIAERFPEPGSCRVFAGKGNNGGDALVLARLLAEMDWQVEVECLFSPTEMSDLAQKASSLWSKLILREIAPHGHRGRTPRIVIDGLLGIGAKGEVRSPLREAVSEINAERRLGAVVFALDLPSGLGTSHAVVADHTLTVGCVKNVLLADAATNFVGRISVLPLAELTGQVRHKPSEILATAESLRHLLPPRPFDQHKGQSGRVAIVAGSLGTSGAAVLAANGALRAGAGLVSLYCPPEIYPFVASLLPPEVMARPWENLEDLAKEKLDGLAIGPGLDPDFEGQVLPLIEAAARRKIPMVLDAGVFSMLALKRSFRRKLSSFVLLTPHPGELERLSPRNGRSRVAWAEDFSFANAPTLLLKGARTVVAARGRLLSYNSTGHPGMATGGMGDTLTGVCAALLGQKLSTYDAARLGAWVCGRAAEIALLEDGHSQESLLPTDLDRCLGRAFRDLRAGVF